MVYGFVLRHLHSIWKPRQIGSNQMLVKGFVHTYARSQHETRLVIHSIFESEIVPIHITHTHTHIQTGSMCFWSCTNETELDTNMRTDFWIDFDSNNSSPNNDNNKPK